VTRAINRGEIIKAGDILVERRPKPRSRDVLPPTRPRSAWRRVKSCAPGQPLRASDLMKPSWSSATKR